MTSAKKAKRKIRNGDSIAKDVRSSATKTNKPTLSSPLENHTTQ
jgi:hypothetical protein